MEPVALGAARARVERACRDREAAERLLRELLPRVRNLVRYLVRGDEDVDDIAQEALVAVLRGLPGYRGEGRLEAWVDRIVARTTFAELPRRRRSPARPGREAVDLSALPAGSAAMEQYLARRRLAGLLDGLPEAQRHVVVLHHIVGLTVPELSVELGVPAETVRSRLRLGRGRLEALARAETEGDRPGAAGENRTGDDGRIAG